MRAHTEVGSALSTAINQGQTGWVSAEDGNTALTGSMIVQALATPLLATTAATESSAGTTETGRSDQYYVAADYTAWGLKETTAAGAACTYYMADLNNVTGLFSGNWYPSNAQVSQPAAPLLSLTMTVT